ncbi:MAG: hypothetical protein V3V15_03105 [Sphingorhabdus sp.]
MAEKEYGLELSELDALKGLDTLIVAVNHRQYLQEGAAIGDRLNGKGVLVDVKSMLNPQDFDGKAVYWSL